MTKKINKLLSIVIVFCLSITIFSPALSTTVFSADISLEDEILAFDAKVDVAELDAETAAAFNSLISSYAALSETEKEDFDVFAFDKLLQLVITHYRAVYKAENPSSATKAQCAYGYEKAKELLVPPAYLDAAAELRVKLDNKSLTASDKMAAFAAASSKARLFVGAWYASYNMFYYSISQYPTKAIELVVTAYATEKVAETPNPDPKPTRPSKPQAKNYPEGENDPAYIADFAAWLVTEEAYYVWYTDDQNYRVAFELEALNDIVDIAPEYADFLSVTLQMKEAKALYDQGADAKALAASAIDSYNALSDLSKLFIEKYTKYIYYIPVDKGVSWTFDYHKPATFVTACGDIVNEELLFVFIDLIEDTTLPYTREDIDNVKAAYANVPKSLINNIPADILQKYRDVLAAIGPDVPSTEELDLTGKPKTKVIYPYTGKAGVEDMYNTLGTILSDVFNIDVEELINGNVYTNDMVGTIVKAIYPTLGEASSLIAQGPNDLATKLDEDKFQGAKNKLVAAVSEYDASNKPIKNLADWENVSFESGDWGFEDGDREGFLDAASASFRALSILTLAIKFENVISATNGTYTYNAYENLIPIFEALDLEGVISSHEYTLYVGEETDSYKKMDRRIRPILVPIVNLLDDLAEDPINTILDLLPKFAMLVNTGLLNDQISTIVSEISFVTIDAPDLTTTGIFQIIAPMLSEIEIEPAVTDYEGNIIEPAVLVNIKLDEQKFVELINDLEGCGVYSMHDSVSRSSIYSIGIDSDKADACTVLYYWLHSELSEEENMDSIVTALSSMEMDTFELLSIQILLIAFQNVPASVSLNLFTILVPVVSRVLQIAKVLGAMNAISSI